MSPYSTDRPRNYDNVGKLASGCKRVGCVARGRVQRVAQPFAIERFHQQTIQSGRSRECGQGGVNGDMRAGGLRCTLYFVCKRAIGERLGEVDAADRVCRVQIGERTCNAQDPMVAAR